MIKCPTLLLDTQRKDKPIITNNRNMYQKQEEKRIVLCDSFIECYEKYETMESNNGSQEKQRNH